MKKWTLSRWKHEADKYFSLYIRAKYAKVCYTCGARGKTLQCGHFVARSYLATRFDEDNCRPQCVGCNLFGGGKPLDFEEHLRREIGDERVDALKKRRHTITKITPKEYEIMIELYKRKI